MEESNTNRGCEIPDPVVSFMVGYIILMIFVFLFLFRLSYPITKEINKDETPRIWTEEMVIKDTLLTTSIVYFTIYGFSYILNIFKTTLDPELDTIS